MKLKTKLVSMLLTFAMLATSGLCLLPVAAEADYDTQAKEQGYVCRIGTAEEAAKNNFSGYYKYFSAADTGYTDTEKNALVEGFKNANNDVTITLINTVNVSQNVSGAQSTKYLHGSVAIQSGKTLTVDGNGQTYNSKWSFRADGGTITVKNCNIVLTNGSTECFGDVRQNGTLTYENCTLSAEAVVDRSANGHFIAVFPATMATMNLKDCTISIVGSNNGGSMFRSDMGDKFTLNLENVKFDTSKNSNLAGINIGAGTLNVKGSELTIGCNAIQATKITVENSKLTAVNNGNGNLFNNSGSKDASIKVTDSTLTAKNYVFNITGCNTAVSVELSGNTVVNGTNRAFSITNNTCPVTVTAKGTTEIRSAGEGGNAIYVCGSDTNASFNLTLAENAKLTSDKEVISFAHGSSAITKATVSFLDRATVEAKNDKCVLNAFNRPVTYIVSDKATITATATPALQNTSQLKEYKLYTPTMLVGASVRIVEGSNGIRFTSTLDNKAAMDVRYGTLIAKKSELGSVDFTVEAMTATGVKFANIVATEEGTVAGDAVNTYNAALTNLPEDQFVTDFAARAYAVYTVDGKEYTVYSDFNETDNVRNISDVAAMARADTQTGSDEIYRYEVAEGVWSRYTKSQYDLLLTFIKKK